MRGSRDCAVILALGGCTAALPGVAVAQTPVPQPATEAAASPQRDTGQIQEIIVSARRRSETLQRTPVAITAIQPSQLEAKAAMNTPSCRARRPAC